MKVVNINTMNHHLLQIQNALGHTISPDGGCGEDVLGINKSNNIQKLLERHENSADDTKNNSVNFSITGISKLLPNLYLCGGTAASIDMMSVLNVSFVVNATSETELPNTPLPKNTNYLRVPIKDNKEADIQKYFHQVADLIDKEKETEGVSLVHCVAGVSRSASLCIAYLIKYNKMSLKEAYNHVKSKRPHIRPNISFVRQLMEFEETVTGSKSVSMVYCHAIDQEIPDIYEHEYKTMELLYQKFRRNIARR